MISQPPIDQLLRQSDEKWRAVQRQRVALAKDAKATLPPLAWTRDDRIYLQSIRVNPDA